MPKARYSGGRVLEQPQTAVVPETAILEIPRFLLLSRWAFRDLGVFRVYIGFRAHAPSTASHLSSMQMQRGPWPPIPNAWT